MCFILGNKTQIGSCLLIITRTYTSTIKRLIACFNAIMLFFQSKEGVLNVMTGYVEVVFFSGVGVCYFNHSNQQKQLKKRERLSSSPF